MVLINPLLGLLHPLQGARARAVVINVSQRGEARPELAHERAVVAVVQITQNGLDGFGGLLGIIEGDATIGVSITSRIE